MQSPTTAASLRDEEAIANVPKFCVRDKGGDRKDAATALFKLNLEQAIGSKSLCLIIKKY